MKKFLAIVGASIMPVITLAQYNPSQGVTGLFTLIGSWLKLALPLLISLAVVWFVWNIFRYMIAGNEDDKKAAKMGMIWGIIGIFVMVSVWGLVGILQSTFGTSGAGASIGNQLPI